MRDKESPGCLHCRNWNMECFSEMRNNLISKSRNKILSAQSAVLFVKGTKSFCKSWRHGSAVSRSSDCNHSSLSRYKERNELKLGKCLSLASTLSNVCILSLSFSFSGLFSYPCCFRCFRSLLNVPGQVSTVSVQYSWLSVPGTSRKHLLVAPHHLCRSSPRASPARGLRWGRWCWGEGPAGFEVPVREPSARSTAWEEVRTGCPGYRQGPGLHSSKLSEARAKIQFPGASRAQLFGPKALYEWCQWVPGWWICDRSLPQAAPGAAGWAEQPRSPWEAKAAGRPEQLGQQRRTAESPAPVLQGSLGGPVEVQGGDQHPGLRWEEITEGEVKETSQEYGRELGVHRAN